MKIPQTEAKAVVQEPQSRLRWAARLVICVLVATVMTAVTWGQWRPIGDLYVGLAGGRDVMAGHFGNMDNLSMFTWLKKAGIGPARLGEPDDWSFITPSNQVWINQNWGTHLLFYGSYKLAGENGLLGLKAALLIAAVLCMGLAARERGAEFSIGLLVGGAMLIAGINYIDQRPNLTTLVLAPVLLWLIYRSEHKPKRIWAAVVVATLWANMHGGFMLALGMLWLWAICQTAPALWADDRRKTFMAKLLLAIGAAVAVATLLHGGFMLVLVMLWLWAICQIAPAKLPLAIGAIAATVLSVITSPFGWENITHPLIVGNDPTGRWRGVDEWAPVFPMHPMHYGTRAEFFICLGILAGLVAVWIIVEAGYRRRRPGASQLAMAALVFVAAIMGVCKALTALNGGPTRPMSVMDEEGVINETRLAFLLFSLAALAFGGLLIYTLSRRASKHDSFSQKERTTEQPVETMFFDVGLGLIVIWMAFSARRFIPLSVILLSPLVAVRLDWLLVRLRNWVLPTALAAAILVIPSAKYGNDEIKQYSPANPFTASKGIFQRMVVADVFPWGVEHFINDNNVTGRVLNQWRWEGYLHWTCPQLKLFLGGRAQQVYHDEKETMMTRWDQACGNPLKLLPLNNVHLVIEPLDDPQSDHILNELVYNGEKPANAGAKSKWAIVYYDPAGGGRVVIADGADPEMAKLIREVADSKAKFRDEGVGALSRAMCLWSPVTGAKPDETFKAFVAAARAKPTAPAYFYLRMLATNNNMVSQTIDFFSKEYDRLVDPNLPISINNLECRSLICKTMCQFYGQGNNTPPTIREENYKLWIGRLKETDQEISQAVKDWR